METPKSEKTKEPKEKGTPKEVLVPHITSRFVVHTTGPHRAGVNIGYQFNKTQRRSERYRLVYVGSSSDVEKLEIDLIQKRSGRVTPEGYGPDR